MSTTIECIDEQISRFFWDEDSLHEFAIALSFYFQEVSLNLVIEQPFKQLMVCSALVFHINHCQLSLAPVLVQDVHFNDCNRVYY